MWGGKKEGGKRGEELDARGYNSMGVVPWASTRDRQLWKIDGSSGFFSPLNNALTMQNFTLFDGSNFESTVVGCFYLTWKSIEFMFFGFFYSFDVVTYI